MMGISFMYLLVNIEYIMRNNGKLIYTSNTFIRFISRANALSLHNLVIFNV